MCGQVTDDITWGRFWEELSRLYCLGALKLHLFQGSKLAALVGV